MNVASKLDWHSILGRLAPWLRLPGENRPLRPVGQAVASEIFVSPQPAAQGSSTDRAEAQPRDARRRRQLIEATIESIARHGLSGTTVARVARAAGLSTGIVNFYFQTKDALLLATLEHVDGQYMARQREAVEVSRVDPVLGLEAMIAAAFDPEFCDRDRVAVWSAFWGEAGARHDYMRICAAREAELEAKRVEALGAVAAAGGHTHLEVEALGRAFHHLLSSLPEAMLGDPGPFDLERARATCRGFLRSIFPGEFSEKKLPALPAKETKDETEAEARAGFDTLPTWIYQDPEFFELEKEMIFKREWILLGHGSQLKNAGDYIAAELLGERIFVLRGKDGKLRGFDNVCRHRASKLVEGSSGHCSGSVVCPYHGWRYGLDGRLKGVPSESRFSELNKAEIRLPELAVEEWMGFVFVRFSSEGPGVAEMMRPNAEEAEHYRFAEMEPLGPARVLEGDFNWKLFVENDSEGYHIPMGHPGLQRLFGSSYVEDFEDRDGTQAYSQLREQESSVWSERMYQRLLPEIDHLPERLRRAWVYYGLFPGAVIQACPDVADCYQILPRDADSCQILTFRVALPDAGRRMNAARYLSDRIIKNVVNEDLALCRAVAGGVRSGRYLGGYFSELESGVRIFRDKLKALIPVAGVAEYPSSGRVTQLNAELMAGQRANRFLS